MQLKILITSQYFYPELFRINDLAIGLVEQGHEVTVLTGQPNYPDGKFYEGYGWFKKKIEVWNNINIIRVPLVARGKKNAIRLIMNYLTFAFFGCLRVSIPFADSFDLIFVFQPSPITSGLPAIVFKKIKHVPIFFWVQDLWPESLAATNVIRSIHILKWVGLLTKFIYSKCDRILVQSKAFIPSIKQFDVSPEKILYFPNSAEATYTCLQTLIEIPYNMQLPKGFRIIFAGNIGVSQAFETILEAATLLKNHVDIHWIIIGNGRQKTWLEQQIIKRNLQSVVHLLGAMPVENMPYYFAQADALLVTLKRDPIFDLTIPSKVQSYLASGKPIIAAIDGEAARIVQESEAGLTGAAEDAEALSKNVMILYNTTSHDREIMGKKGREYFEKHFERKKLLDQLERWMQEVVIEYKK